MALLAAAGLIRLGLTDRIAGLLDPDTWIGAGPGRLPSPHAPATAYPRAGVRH